MVHCKTPLMIQRTFACVIQLVRAVSMSRIVAAMA
jgi:hypothetical protein